MKTATGKAPTAEQQPRVHKCALCRAMVIQIRVADWEIQAQDLH